MHRDDLERDRTKSKRMDRRYWPLVIAGIAGVYAVWFVVLSNAGGTVAYIDAFIVSSGVVAVVMEMMRYREQYVLWIGNDLVSMLMYVVLGDPVYVVKRGIYLMVGIIGIRTWFDLHKRNGKNERSRTMESRYSFWMRSISPASAAPRYFSRRWPLMSRKDEDQSNFSAKSDACSSMPSIRSYA